MTEATETKRASRPFVTIGCKVAVPWIDLRICEEKEVREEALSGARFVKQFQPTSEFIRIRGTAYPRGEPPEGFPEKPKIVNGAAVNEGVPRSKWEAWVKQNGRSPLVVNNMIFAFENVTDLTAFSKEHADETSGLEPIQRSKKEIKDSRLPKPLNAAISGLQEGDASPARIG